MQHPETQCPRPNRKASLSAHRAINGFCPPNSPLFVLGLSCWLWESLLTCLMGSQSDSGREILRRRPLLTWMGRPGTRVRLFYSSQCIQCTFLPKPHSRNVPAVSEKRDSSERAGTPGRLLKPTLGTLVQGSAPSSYIDSAPPRLTSQLRPKVKRQRRSSTPSLASTIPLSAFLQFSRSHPLVRGFVSLA